ncbi:chloride intracellular channel protein 4-like [Neosynchiropus ocellatus]
MENGYQIMNEENTQDAEMGVVPADLCRFKVPPFVMVGSEGEILAFSQRLYMILKLKGRGLNVATMDQRMETGDPVRVTYPAFLTFDGDVSMDVEDIEEFLEDMFCPPKYPKLAAKHMMSNIAGNDIFAMFSAYITNGVAEANEVLEKGLTRTLKRLDGYLNVPLPDEIPASRYNEGVISERCFLDGNKLTLADCNLMPKLHIVKVVTKKYRDYEIPPEMTGVWRYLKNAYAREEFANSCPEDTVIEMAYKNVVGILAYY